MSKELYYFEDFVVGQKFISTIVREMTEESIISFGRQFDPQVFHTDPEKAKKTIFKGLIASGSQIVGESMALIVNAMPDICGGGLVGMGIDIRWVKPVRPGDVLSCEVEILDARLSEQTPQSGIVRFRATTYNQKHEIVQQGEVNIFVPPSFNC